MAGAPKQLYPTEPYLSQPIFLTDSSGNPISSTNPFSVTGGTGLALIDGQKTTYRASTIGLAAVTAATDIFTITGSATTTVRVLRVELSGTIATAAMYLDVQGVVRSTANTAGTSTTPTVVPLDSGNAAGTAVVKAYTANPTTGSLVGNICSDKLFLPLTGTPATVTRLVWDFGNRPGQAVVLRGTTQVFGVNLNGVTIANATSLDIAIEWSEE